MNGCCCLLRFRALFRPDDVTGLTILLRGVLAEIRDGGDGGTRPFRVVEAMDVLRELAGLIAPDRYGNRPVSDLLEACGVEAGERQRLADALQALRSRVDALETGRGLTPLPAIDVVRIADAIECALDRLFAEHRRATGGLWKCGLLRLVVVAVAAGVVWVAGTAVFFLWRNVQDEGLRVTYYRGEAFEHPMARDTEFSLFKAFGRRGPAWWMPRNHFSSRWEGWLLVPVSTNYAFYSQSDDGIRLMLDGKTVIDHWQSHVWEGSGRHGKLTLDRGPHRIVVEHHDSRGPSGLRIRWCGGPIPPNTVISAPFLSKVRRDAPVGNDPP
jgi:hypothetical protein